MLKQEQILGYVCCRAVYHKHLEIPSKKKKKQTASQTSGARAGINLKSVDTTATTAMNVTDSSHPMIFMYYYYYQHPFYHQYHYMATKANCNN